MVKRKILMPVRTIAEWGGVHEWTVDASVALIKEGHQVTFVGSGDLFRERALATGSDFIEIDWNNWSDYVDFITPDMGFDLIFAHAPHARAYALKVNERLKIELYVMIHGAYHDYMYTWSDRVTGFLAASSSLVHFTQRFGRVDPWKVANVPNAAHDGVFDMPIIPLEEKTSTGFGHIATAARLAYDKVSQIDAVEKALISARAAMPDVQWVIDVYGDGPMRNHYEESYNRMVTRLGKSEVRFHGWVGPEQIPFIMNQAVLGVAAGMAGVRTIAAGSLCIGAGARNMLGVQVGQNLRAGIWSNFGDHGAMRFQPTNIHDDLERLLHPGHYEEVLELNRRILRSTNSQSVVNKQMLSALQC